MTSFPGGCLCGAVRYEIRRKHLNAMHCYCGMCRRAHGGAFSTHVVARPDQIVWLQGRETLHAFESSPGAFREFCPKCGTHLVVHGQTGDDAWSIPAGTLDGDPPLTILGHIFTESRVGWIAISDDLPQHRQWPPGIRPAPPAPD
jgi:hypothetical protein